MNGREDVAGLVAECRTFLGNQDTENMDLVETKLIRNGDWTPRAAEHLLQLARNYGSFMLRNALAISLALEIEDGDLGF